MLAVVLAWWLAKRHTRTHAVTLAALASGLTLALEGIYLHRTVTVSYEVLGLLLAVRVGFVIVALTRWVNPSRRRAVTVGLLVMFRLCALVSLPLAFLGLEALAYQRTSDDLVTRVARNCHLAEVSPQHAYEWLHGGELRCPTVMQSSWQTVGAQQYPSSPISIERPTYAETVASQHVIYTTGRSDPVTFVVPTTDRTC